jgi:hypothetical protein
MVMILENVRGFFCKLAGGLRVDRLGAICGVDQRSGGGRGRGPAPWTGSTGQRWTKPRGLTSI